MNWEIGNSKSKRVLPTWRFLENNKIIAKWSDFDRRCSSYKTLQFRGFLFFFTSLINFCCFCCVWNSHMIRNHLCALVFGTRPRKPIISIMKRKRKKICQNRNNDTNNFFGWMISNRVGWILYMNYVVVAVEGTYRRRNEQRNISFIK